MRTRKLLVVDDRPEVRNNLIDVLGSGYEVLSVETDIEAMRCLQKECYDMLITNTRLPAMGGGDLLTDVAQTNPDVVIVAVSSEGNVDNPAQLAKLGIDDYVGKPFTAAKLKHRIDKAFQFADIRKENRLLHLQLAETAKRNVLLGRSEPMRNIREKIKLVAPTRAAVLISGESGTGKKLIASEIHNAGERRQKPFIKINCAALPDALLESRLFGHEQGAFPGALDMVYGKFELADGGTILLEEVGAVNPAVQEKLLRVLQDGEFDRIGGTVPVRTDVRVIATTSCNLRKAIDSGAFREDLFLRLNVIPIEVPTLRERREDIPLLIDHYIGHYARTNRKEPVKLTQGAMRALCNAPWKGNVRELENRIERAVIMGGGEKLDEDFFHMDGANDGRFAVMKKVFEKGSVREMEKLMILNRLRDTKDNRTRAAKSLEISVRTLRNKLHEYNVKRESPVEKEEELIPILS